jgi:hypothetical protein
MATLKGNQENVSTMRSAVVSQIQTLYVVAVAIRPRYQPSTASVAQVPRTAIFVNEDAGTGRCHRRAILAESAAVLWAWAERTTAT